MNRRSGDFPPSENDWPRFLEPKSVTHDQLGNLVHQVIIFCRGNLIERVIRIDGSLDGMLDSVHLDVPEVLFQV